jgi:hypothetical protein
VSPGLPPVPSQRLRVFPDLAGELGRGWSVEYTAT